MPAPETIALAIALVALAACLFADSRGAGR